MKLSVLSIRLTVLLALCLSLSLKTDAQTATFSNLRLEHNVPDNNGRQMLRFHYSMAVSGAQGHKVHAVMFVDIPKGVGHKYPNGNVMTQDASSLYCSWQDTYTTGDWWVGIYNDLLNPLPGKNTYYTRLFAWDETLGRWIGNSDFVTYDMTGNQPVQNNTPVYVPVDNTPPPCVGCHGTKRCSICNGTGIASSVSRDKWRKCGGCDGSGICQACRYR